MTFWHCRAGYGQTIINELASNVSDTICEWTVHIADSHYKYLVIGIHKAVCMINACM